MEAERFDQNTTTGRRRHPYASRIRWAGLAGRERGQGGSGGRTFVLLHGLTFDHRMWEPVLEALPEQHHGIALDLPGHGGSPPSGIPGLVAIVEAIHAAVLDAGIGDPIMVGHSIGGPLATIYAATYPSAGVISVEAPIRLEPFAAVLHSLRPQLTGNGFDQTWARFQASWQMGSVPEQWQDLLSAGKRPSQKLVVDYQSDLLDRPIEEVVRWRDDGLARLRASETPYLTLHANPVDPDERAWLSARLPQAESVVWPVGHHFPHLADPGRFAALLAGFAAGLGPRRGVAAVTPGSLSRTLCH
jgi:pimeloyl-ACP methyl ester carboxylesterase